MKRRRSNFSAQQIKEAKAKSRSVATLDDDYRVNNRVVRAFEEAMSLWRRDEIAALSKVRVAEA